MSESEKKKRLEYRQKRKNIIFIQSIIAIVIALTVAISAFVFFRIDNEYHVSYAENSSVDYKVYLKENDFYEEEFLGSGQAYIAALIDSVNADFNYSFALDSDAVKYDATYSIGAKLVVTVKQTGKTLLSKDYPIKTNIPISKTGSKTIKIKDTATIDYDVYNQFANELLSVYDLSGVECSLNLFLKVDVSGGCADFESKKLSTHTTSLKIPLTQDLVDINISASLPHSENSVIVCSKAANRNVAKWFAIIGLILEGLLLIELVIFIFLTRNYDINYEIKIKRLVSAYKSYIQKILTEFCMDGYQVLKVETFTEMLDIRDVLNLPILMSENADKTCTTFMIPTNNNVLYLHEIKVEDYDEIYSDGDGSDEIIAEEIVATDATADFYSSAKNDYSFEAKLHLASEETRLFYSEINAFINSYGLKINRSWKKERVQFGRKTYAILSFRGKTLSISFALNPIDYENTKYKFKDVSSIKKFAQTPAQMKITSERKCNWVKELFVDMLAKDGVENKNLPVEVKRIKPKTKKKLIEENLIKISE